MTRSSRAAPPSSSRAAPPSSSPAAPPSLLDPRLDPVWEAVRARLERRGSDDRGRVRVPPLDARARFLLGALVSGRVGATLDLDVLERALRALGVAESLPAALGVLGHALSDAPAARRAKRALARAAREAVRAEVTSWPEGWAAEWADDIARSGVLAGLDPSAARDLLHQVRMVLDHLGEAEATRRTRSRTEVAAAVLGSAHALDRGTRAGAAVTRALAFRLAVHGRGADRNGDPAGDLSGRGADSSSDRSSDRRRDRRAIWALAGAPPDLVSATVLCWNLLPSPASGLRTLLAEASRIGVPLHLTQYALRLHPVVLPAGADVLAVENPRVVEAAAEARSPLSVVALNGNPSAAARLLVDQLLGCGVRVRYHGDFDSPGIAICGRMHALGLVPWRMDADDYVHALDLAERAGTPLPTERRPPPATPWSPALRETFDLRRKVVHEELLLGELLRSPSS